MGKAKRKKREIKDADCGLIVCDCGAILGVEEWTCSACGHDPLDESEPDFGPEYDDD